MKVMAEETNQFEISQLECHFKWFDELNIEFNGKWLSGLLNKKLHNDLMRSSLEAPEVDKEELGDEDTVEDLKNRNETLRPNRLKELSWRFTLLLRDTFEGKFKEGFEKTEELLNSEEAKNPCQPQTHIDTFSYVVLANQINILKQWRNNCSDCPMDEIVIDDIASKMEPLRNSIETNEGKSFICGMKCYLSRDMMDTKLSVDFAKEVKRVILMFVQNKIKLFVHFQATELNPQYAGWHESLYTALRELRRSTNFGQRPSPQEIEACEKVFELESDGDPNNISIGTAVTMSNLCAELLLSCSRGSREHQEISDKAIRFAR